MYVCLGMSSGALMLLMDPTHVLVLGSARLCAAPELKVEISSS